LSIYLRQAGFIFHSAGIATFLRLVTAKIAEVRRVESLYQESKIIGSIIIESMGARSPIHMMLMIASGFYRHRHSKYLICLLFRKKVNQARLI